MVYVDNVGSKNGCGWTQAEISLLFFIYNESSNHFFKFQSALQE